MRIRKPHHPATDTHPATPQDATPCPTARARERPLYPSPTHLLAIPTEIRLQIYHHYLLSQNIPDRHFADSSMLAYWSDACGVTSGYYTRASHPGRRASIALLCLLLVNRQVRLEAEEVLYGAFVFCIPTYLSSPAALQALLYSATGPGPFSSLSAHPASRLRNIQLNLSLNSRYWYTPPHSVFARWRAAFQVLATALPQLRSVGLAVDCVPARTEHALTAEEVLDLVRSFVRVFTPVAAVRVRFADVDLGRAGPREPVSSPWCAELLEEERLLLRLRDDEGLTWHGVAMHFSDPRSELYSVTGLQARYARLKARLLVAELEVECLARLEEEFKSSFA